MIKRHLLGVLTAFLFLGELNRLLDSLIAESTQLGHHPGHLGGLDVKIGLGLGGLGGETANVFHHVINEPKKTVIK